MDRPTDLRPWTRMEELLDGGDEARLRAYLQSLSMVEAARAILRLSQAHQQAVLARLEPARAAEVIAHVPLDQAPGLLRPLDPDAAASILGALPSNIQADLLTAMKIDEAEPILMEMDPVAAQDAQRLAQYPSDVAGGLMITEYLSYPLQATVKDVLDDLREHAEQYGDYDVQYVYVVAPDETLAGVLRLRDLLLTASRTRVASLMISDPLVVSAEASLDELAEFFAQTEFYGAPVVDDARRLVGVVRRHDVEESRIDRADRDYLKSQGIVGGMELRSMTLLTRCRRRLSWLSINVVLNIIAASVIALYLDTLTAAIALAAFLPIISDLSGCSGNQAVAVSMREMTLGLVKPTELLRVWLKEVSAGLINGFILGVMIALVGWLWKGNAYVGLVCGVALWLNTIVAVSIGGTIPLLLKRLKIDPALASGPILTTVTDACGFILVLSLATMMLSRIATG